MDKAEGNIGEKKSLSEASSSSVLDPDPSMKYPHIIRLLELGSCRDLL